MPSTPAPRVVPVGHDRLDEFITLDQWAFAFDGEGVDAEAATRGFEWDRTVGAVLDDADDAPLVGISSVYSLRMPVPGAEISTAGLTWVGVHPQHRRRGVLTTMMRHHLETVHETGAEPVSALWAAEPAIYGRYGYGLSTLGVGLTLPRGAAMRDVPGTEGLTVTLEHVDADRHVDLVAACYDRARTNRPGMVSRDSTGLRRRVLDDPPRWRDGAESLRALVVRDGRDDVRAYALFRRKASWGDGGPRGTVTVNEAVALDAAAARVLWGRLVDLDLMTTTTTDARPLDDALLHLLVDLRATTPKVADGLWVRLVDVDTAMAARRYAVDVDVVMEVRDPLCPWNAGRWHLAGGRDDASCERTRRDADLRLDVEALGAAYLGGQTLAALASAGRVEELRDGALHAASAALSWPVQPYCGWVF